MRIGGGIAAIILAVLALSLTPTLAGAQTSPGPTPTDSPSATPSPTTDPTPTPSEDPSPTDSPTTDPSPTKDPGSPTPGPTGRPKPGGLLSVAPPAIDAPIGSGGNKGPHSRGARDRNWAPNPKWGAYSTKRLVVAERALERHGVPEREALAKAFAPFPVGGLAVWSDTWGAPRYAGGYHPHHGQDLLCAMDTPLLAVQPGTVQLGSDPLGGTTIELTLRDGSFWYYAHLDHYAKGLTDGEHVSTGQVIGACGRSGDATVPHLHFSFFTSTMQARNPMHALLGWLHQAERRAGVHPSNGKGVRTPAPAELDTPPVLHARPDTTSVGWVPPTYVVAPEGGSIGAATDLALALLLAPVAVLASSRRARSWVVGRISA